MDDSPRTTAPYGCAFFILLGVLAGGAQLGHLVYDGYRTTHHYDNWIVGVLIVVGLYVLLFSKYVFALPLSRTSRKDRMFILGRRLCFLTFPSITFVIALAVWDLTGSSRTAAFAGLIAGTLISKFLQVTLFAHEYTFRDKLD
jgi:hypothetical protein